MPSFEDRQALAEAIGQDTLAAWQNFGARCLEELSEEDPEGFLRFCLSVLPDSLELELDRGIVGE